MSMDVTAPPPPNIPGIGSLFAPVQVPIPEFDLPTDLLQDLLALMEQLGALFPSGLFKANPDLAMKNVLDFIANILSQLAPFLSFYNFIMALLNLIVCIIEVLCAIPNPFAVAAKLKKLFAECLPPFLNLFPWLALLAMILSLLLLILALILYIVEQVLAIIAAIIRNIAIFVSVAQIQDAESVIAATEKIAMLLCSIENLMALFLGIAAILAVIKALAAFAGGGICDEDDSEGCCPSEICPAFIRDNFEITSTTGEFVYHPRISLDVTGIPSIPAALASAMASQMAPLREERWQLFDASTTAPDEPISLIITPPVVTTPFYGSQIFYPDQVYDATTPPTRAPYTVDMRMLIDPGVFHPTDIDGYRYMRINDCIVVRKPYVGEIAFNSLTVDNGTGTFNLEGGVVFEDDGVTPFEVESTVGSLTVMSQANLNEFIFLDPISSSVLPTSEDGYRISDVEFTWKPVHPTLAANNLITVGCFPQVALEKRVINGIILSEGTASILARLPAIGDLGDDVTATVQCVQDAVGKFRAGVNETTAATFQAEVETCLNDLSAKITDVYCDSLIEGVSQYQSSFSFDIDVQFTTAVITLTFVMRDAGGTIISNNIPAECLDDIIDKLKATVTFGEVSDFVYDSSNGVFTAKIGSDSGGDGEAQVFFDNQVVSVLTTSVDFDTPSSVAEVSLPYTFVDAPSDKAVERDLTDVSGDGN